MTLIQFTRNNHDHSTDKGFQFEFFCDRCGNGFMSSFQPSATGMAASALRAAGGLFGGILIPGQAVLVDLRLPAVERSKAKREISIHRLHVFAHARSLHRLKGADVRDDARDVC